MSEVARPVLARLRELATAATPGPWTWRIDSGDLMLTTSDWAGAEGHILTPFVCEACRKRDAPCLGPQKADEAYLAAVSPDVVLALLDVVEAAVAWRRAWEAGSPGATELYALSVAVDGLQG